MLALLVALAVADVVRDSGQRPWQPIAGARMQIEPETPARFKQLYHDTTRYFAYGCALVGALLASGTLYTCYTRRESAVRRRLNDWRTNKQPVAVRYRARKPDPTPHNE